MILINKNAYTKRLLNYKANGPKIRTTKAGNRREYETLDNLLVSQEDEKRMINKGEKCVRAYPIGTAPERINITKSQ